MTQIKYQAEWQHFQTGDHEKLGIFNTLEEAIKSIYAWWEENEFTPYYVRTWTENGITTLDYGFHHMFYYILEVSN